MYFYIENLYGPESSDDLNLAEILLSFLKDHQTLYFACNGYHEFEGFTI
jgi:hypothetical protein